MQVFCGIDWAEDHYVVVLVDQAGVVLAISTTVGATLF